MSSSQPGGGRPTTRPQDGHVLVRVIFLHSCLLLLLWAHPLEGTRPLCGVSYEEEHWSHSWGRHPQDLSISQRPPSRHQHIGQGRGAQTFKPLYLQIEFLPKFLEKKYFMKSDLYRTKIAYLQRCSCIALPSISSPFWYISSGGLPEEEPTGNHVTPCHCLIMW